MPERTPIVSTEQPRSLRRSPRFLRHKNTPEPQQPTSLRKSPRLHGKRITSEPEDLKTPKTNSRNNRFLSSPPESKKYPEKSSKKLSKSACGSRNLRNFSSGLRRSPRLNSCAEVFRSLRRSPRFTNQQNMVDARVDCEEKVSMKTRKSDVGNMSSGSREASKLNGSVEEVVGHRRSQRVSNQRNVVYEHMEESGSGTSLDEVDLTDDEKSLDEVDLTDDEKADKVVNSCEQIVRKRERRTRRSSISPEAVIVEGEERMAKDIGKNRKRKRDEEDGGMTKEWTKEQELALQRAYFVAKPTPNFWKKVSKLVPGKSAQECFDKVHSDNLTPLQPQPRLRTKKSESSPIHNFSLSESKLLKPMVKRLSCNKQKARPGRKIFRHLIQKHYFVDQDYEADLFSVLEPNMDPSTQAIQPGVILSTPMQSSGKQGFLKKCHERPSSHKKPLSRLSGSSLTTLASPPVLKQVKNRVLHDKYIDQLHCREVKRKAASARARKFFIVKEDRKDIPVQNIDVVRAAKNALASDARDVISQYQHLQANVMSNSDSNDDDSVDSDDDESEDGT
uniref:Myb-like domain-containing protein n=2 Tax=Quercus lobata TaxID=97700 RepID=A0A7N2LYX6_QUELO